jgi:transposase
MMRPSSMRSSEQKQNELFCTISIESLIPADHPLRVIRKRADAALEKMEVDWNSLYSERGRPSVPPEQLLRAMLLQVLYGYRSERRLMGEMRYNFALRWFVGLTMSEEPWDVTVFTKNRQRFLDGNVAQQWLKAVVIEAHRAGLIDEEHFSVDGTLIQAWASEKSYQPKEDPPKKGTGRGGKLLKRDLYESTTDSDARLYRKSARDPFRLSYLGHLSIENGNGLIVASTVTRSATNSERQAATRMLKQIQELGQQLGWKTRRMTVAADTAYHEQDFVNAVQQLGIEPHLPAWPRRKRPDWIGAALRQTKRYQRSRSRRKWIERCFAWLKGPAGQRQTRFRGVDRVAWSFDFAAGVYNLLRMMKLSPQP